MKWFKKSSQLKTNGAKPVIAPRVLLVSDYLSERSVLFFSASVVKEEMLFKLVSSLPIADHALALNAVLEREKMGGTVIDSAVSIPHARLSGLKTIELAIGICNDPALPEDRSRLFFLFLSPKEDTKIHLLFLSSLSSLLQTEGFINELTGLSAPHEVVQKIRQIERSV